MATGASRANDFNWRLQDNAQQRDDMDRRDVLFYAPEQVRPAMSDLIEAVRLLGRLGHTPPPRLTAPLHSGRSAIYTTKARGMSGSSEGGR